MKLEFPIFVFLIFVLIPCACSTTQPVDTDISKEGLKHSIAAGDEIVIQAKAHGTPGSSPVEKHTVVVKSITEQTIIVEDADQNEMEFYFSDIATIEKDQFDAEKTRNVAVGTAAAVGSVALGALYLAVAAAGSLAAFLAMFAAM